MEIVVVERRLAAPVSAAGVQADDAAARWCFDQYRCQPSFHLLRLDGRQLCCVFRAPDLEAIRRTARSLAEPRRHTVLGRFLATDRRRLLGLCRSADGSTTGPSRERRRANYWPAVVIMP